MRQCELVEVFESEATNHQGIDRPGNIWLGSFRIANMHNRDILCNQEVLFYN